MILSCSWRTSQSIRSLRLNRNFSSQFSLDRDGKCCVSSILTITTPRMFQLQSAMTVLPRLHIYYARSIDTFIISALTDDITRGGSAVFVCSGKTPEREKRLPSSLFCVVKTHFCSDLIENKRVGEVSQTSVERTTKTQDFYRLAKGDDNVAHQTK